MCKSTEVSAFISVDVALIDKGLLGSKSLLVIDSVAIVAILFIYLVIVIFNFYAFVPITMCSITVPEVEV
tara:strand:+ start:655 stop:864 length:210 start_codon:yes stop_codon:yes gene_type:complete